MRIALAVSLSVASLLATPALARGPETPINDRQMTAEDVATSPATDLNLRKEDVPALLIAAQDSPYDLAGLGRCSQIAAAVGELDAILGDDIDLHPEVSKGIDPGKLAQLLVNRFIPFRGLIREISGANEQQRRWQAAIYAGTARRAFLKGVGLSRGCRYPARPATPAVLAQRAAESEAAKQEKSGNARGEERASPAERREGDGVTFVSKPVVQEVK